MKKILLLFLIIITTSCDYNRPSQEGTVSQKDNSVIKLEDYVWSTTKVVEYDSCEYILIFGDGITHKGNCKYCEERRKKNEVEF